VISRAIILQLQVRKIERRGRRKGRSKRRRRRRRRRERLESNSNRRCQFSL